MSHLPANWERLSTKQLVWMLEDRWTLTLTDDDLDAVTEELARRRDNV